jgi:DNA-binding winged helix-turn-helix (wHTH) protein
MTGSLSFGPFVLDVDARELRRGREAVVLSPKAYQLLELLVTNRPKAFSKTALQDALWPDTFVVEKNLVNLVAEIRAALGDHPSSPRFVRTVRRFGYAFRDETSADAATHATHAPFQLLWPDGVAMLGEGEHVLGRDPDLPLFFDSPKISRRHALIRVAGTVATIEDLGSKNGTFVGASKLESSVHLTDGDRIRVGTVVLTFTASSARGSTITESRAESIRPTARARP